MSHNPLEQFKIEPIVKLDVAGIDLSFTNSSLFMMIAVFAILMFMGFGARRMSLVPGKMQAAGEVFYDMIASTVHDNVGAEGRKYFPLIFSLFMFVLFSNLIGMIPYTFTVTSHIIVTFGMAIILFLFLTATGFARHGTHFFAFFLPSGTPLWLAPLMILIELFSYLSRPISLSIRLAANMIAGHVLLKVLAGFVVMMGLWGWLPLSFIVLMTGFEIFVAVLQAYIFTVLTCVYLNDAVNMH